MLEATYFRYQHSVVVISKLHVQAAVGGCVHIENMKHLKEGCWNEQGETPQDLETVAVILDRLVGIFPLPPIEDSPLNF